MLASIVVGSMMTGSEAAGSGMDGSVAAGLDAGVSVGPHAASKMDVKTSK